MAVVRLEFPPELPVSAARDEIAAALAAHQVVVVAGATGSGKTTQLPKIALQLGRERIAHTQPRRIAARSVAERIAEECGVELGAEIGYQVRFDRRASKRTRVKVLTDGVLLAEIAADPQLRNYDTVIIDEAHERSLTIDVLLGHLKRLLPQRPELKVVVTSATIDPESFAKHFADANGVPAPIIEVEGRTYPVEIRYRPLVGESDVADEDGEVETEDRDYLTGIVDALDELDQETPGDVLVFLSGEAEIRDATEAVRGHHANRPAGYGTTEVLPLFGRLSAADQHRIFATARPAGTRRRIVLATNVAETSLTVPGIRYVVDAGTARISRYSARSRVQRLPIEAISQASAQQRSGRAGRTAPGIAIRLYSEADFAARPEFTDPEILRTSLASVLLQLAELGVDDITSFPFLTPPDAREVRAARDLLIELGALGPSNHRLTKLGGKLARIPLEPRFARMLLESQHFGVTREVLAIVSGLTVHDPRERPLEAREQAAAAHARFADPTSDFLSILSLWNYLETLQREVSGNQFRKRCRAEYLHYLRVREWQDLTRQLERSVKEIGLTVGEPKADPNAVHRSLLPGLLSQLGARVETETAPAKGKRPVTEFAGARGRRFTIFPGSNLAKKPPAFVMAAELVETSRLFARTVAQVDPLWAVAAAGDLVQRSHSEPRWDARAGSAVVTEKITLYGVVLVAGQRKQLAGLDPELARELFVRHALVLGEWNAERIDKRLTAFARHNQGVLSRWQAHANRSRERHPFDETELLTWYLDRIPAEVTDVRHFERWWREALGEQPELLNLPEPSAAADTSQADPRLFPPTWQQGPIRLRLRYRHAPGQDDDGVSVLIDQRDAVRVRELDLGWVVPGLRIELITGLLKTLPKPLRREVVPVNAWAERLARDLPVEPVGEFLPELAALIKRVTFAPVTAADFDPSRLPLHLQPRYVLVDAQGRPRASSRDLATLQPAAAPTPTPTSAAPTEPEPPASTAPQAAPPRPSLIELSRSTDPEVRANAQAVQQLVRALEKLMRSVTRIDLIGQLVQERTVIAELTAHPEPAELPAIAQKLERTLERLGKLS